ncbi:DUF1871 family protein [Cohnella caldifontis]|uniref:DUF1871 family protein n=1 Tax=Cohnella caldifontis TaxID=3027471 RepID=UPI003BB67E7D
MIEKISHVINTWDPARLMSHAPDDEYTFEVMKIYEFLQKEKDPHKLAYEIKNIFNQTFGDEINYDLKTYLEVAHQILS